MAHLVFNDDCLVAEVVLHPDERVSAAQVMDLLVAHGVIHGLQASGIAAAANTVGPATIVVAEGDRPRAGQDGRIDVSFESAATDLAPVIGEDDRADFRNLNRVTTVKAGDVLGRRVPPVKPWPGTTVNGRVIQPPFPKDVLIRVGEGCEVAEDGLSVVALHDGNPYHDGGLFSVRREYVVSGGVNLATGNINFGGDVRIVGHVQMQMEVRATGNIVVTGSVEGARIHCEGDLLVEGGVRHGAKIDAMGNIIASFIESSQVKAKGSLQVKGNLLHSDVEVEGRLVVGGAIIGGKVASGQRGRAGAVGSKAFTPTAVRIVPMPCFDDEFNSLEQEHAKVIETLMRITPRIREAQAALEDTARRSPNSVALRKLLELASLLKQRDSAIENRKKELVRPMTFKPRFDVVEVIYPGVSIQLGTARLHVDRQYGGNTLVEDKGSVALLPLTPT